MEQVNGQSQVGAQITRILLVSPMQAETYRRNRSRIFVSIEGETMLDTMLFQNSRPIDLYTDVAHRAIAQAGLIDQYGDLKAVHGNQIGEFGGSHLTTTSWLKDDQGMVYDMFVVLEQHDMPGTPDSMIEMLAATGQDGENPLIMSIDVEAFVNSDMEAREYVDNQGEQPAAAERPAQTAPQTNQSAPARQAQDDDREPGARGRVKDPANDKRLKQNRTGGTARRPQDDEEPKGQRGRVRSKFDQRLSGNRGPARRAQDDDNRDPPSGGAGRGRGGARRGAGGRGTGTGNRGSGGNAPRADLNTWADGTPRTVSAFKADGVTPRKKPGPQVGARYNKRAA